MNNNNNINDDDGHENWQTVIEQEMPAKEYIATRIYDGKCFVCRRGYKVGKGFAIHHRVYRDGEKTYADFKNVLQYHEYLLPIVLEHKKDFSLLCRKCHFSVERLKRYKKDKLRRLMLLAYDE